MAVRLEEAVPFRGLEIGSFLNMQHRPKRIIFDQSGTMLLPRGHRIEKGYLNPE